MPTLPKCLEGTNGSDKDSVGNTLKATLEDPPSQGVGLKTANDRASVIDTWSTSKTITSNSHKLSNWASGGVRANWSDYKYKTFHSDADTFFKALFEEARVLSNAKFSRTDLFHGHVMWHKTDGLIVIFHAKEYPSDLESWKSTSGALADPKSASFTKHDADYAKRNVRYDFRSNSMSVVTTGLQNGSGQQALDESFNGDAEYVFDINYFPNECQGLNDKVFIA